MIRHGSKTVIHVGEGEGEEDMKRCRRTRAHLGLDENFKCRLLALIIILDTVQQSFERSITVLPCVHEVMD